MEDYIYVLQDKERDYGRIALDLIKKSHEMSLGTFPEVKLSEAREKLAEQKRLRLKQINPLHEKRKHEILKEQQNKKFSEIADLYITTKKKEEWTNPKK